MLCQQIVFLSVDTAYVSKLICDYVENRAELKSLYNRFPTIENFKAQLEAKQSDF